MSQQFYDILDLMYINQHMIHLPAEYLNDYFEDDHTHMHTHAHARTESESED